MIAKIRIIFRILRTRIKRIANHIKRICKSFDKNVVISFGENCLSDNILARNGLKSFSSPYASARSNVEYILAFEKEAFADFLTPQFLKYEGLQNKQVLRNKKYVDAKNHYDHSCLNGFEFTHHDVIGSKTDRKAFEKRCQRMLRLKHKNVIMLYHHRICKETDEALLIAHLADLADIYKSRNNDVHVFMFSQVIVSKENQRKVEHTVNGNINVYKFHTLNVWGGDNQDIFWARCDEDLLREMIADMKEKLV